MAIDSINGVGKSFQTRSILDGFIGFGVREAVQTNNPALQAPSEVIKERNNAARPNVSSSYGTLNDPTKSSRGIFKNQQS